MILRGLLKRLFNILLTCLNHPVGLCFCSFFIFFCLLHKLFPHFCSIFQGFRTKKQKKQSMKTLEIYLSDSLTFGSQDFIRESTAKKTYTTVLLGLVLTIFILIAILNDFGLILVHFCCFYDLMSCSVLIFLLKGPFFCLL